ncbi:MarR family winged helix-turn-helix transcriptional regulator [Pseudactinotalea suaedae]|jgi:DNA-binding MarR family transcriptional regulator|uniref:MarR family winged helix-turn-helix transcriptional regulator n=1 Tax=Pseudactinotalea suaedae TaxID=1524924 RepID=UPI0012E32320|nr:MarR family transcriptional regulator [Pseudactinotalea suaedae]
MTHWLDLEQQRHWRSLLTGTSALFAALNHDLEAGSDLALNEYEVLVRLSESPDRTLRMSVLAEGLVHSRSRITHTVSRMERRGLVRRQAACDDGRGVDCTMTDEGYAALVAAAHVHVTSVRARLVDVLTPAELAAIGEGFERVTARIVEDRPV